MIENLPVLVVVGGSAAFLAFWLWLCFATAAEFERKRGRTATTLEFVALALCQPISALVVVALMPDRYRVTAVCATGVNAALAERESGE